MNRSDAPVVPLPVRNPRASAIERANYVPDLLPRKGAARPVEAFVPPPVVLLLHDGRNGDVLDLVESGLAAGIEDSHLIARHRFAPDMTAGAFTRFLERHRPACVVLVPPLSGSEDLATLCTRAHVRCLRLGVTGDLGCEERRAAAIAVARLVAAGHARIGLVSGAEGSPSAQQRELGYLDAMAEYGLDRGPALIVPGDDTFESGIEAGQLLLEISPRPTAILACNDAMALGVLHAAARSGIAVPEALAVVGFDDTPLARRALPALSSVHVPWERIGREAARRVLSDAQMPPVSFDGELVERASSHFG